MSTKRNAPITLDTLSDAMKSDNPDFLAIANNVGVILSDIGRQGMIGTLRAWSILGEASERQTVKVTGKEVDKFADIANALSLKVGESEATFAGFSRATVSRAWTVYRKVTLTQDKSGVWHYGFESDWSDFATGKAGKPSVNSSVAYVTWITNDRTDKKSSNNASDNDGGREVKAFTVGVKERKAAYNKAVEAMKSADIDAKPAESDAVPTFAAIRLMSTDDIKALINALTGELQRRDNGGTYGEALAPSLPANIDKMTKAELIALMKANQSA